MNLSGLFYSMKYEVPPILAAGGGAIVNVSSVFADRGGPSTDYSSAKHADSPAPPPRTTPAAASGSTNSSRGASTPLTQK